MLRILMIILELALVVAEERLRAVDVVLGLDSVVLTEDLGIEKLLACFVLPIKQLQVSLVECSVAREHCLL